MNELRTKTRIKYIGHMEVTFISDFDPETNETLDTQVKIGGNTLCWIAGATIDEFTKKLVNTIGEYAI